VPRWVIGPTAGGNDGWAYCESDASTPHEILGTWISFDGFEWSLCKSLRFEPKEGEGNDGSFAAAPAPLTFPAAAPAPGRRKVFVDARGAPAWSASNDAQIAAHQERERARAALDERRKASTNLDPAASPQNATRLAELKAELTQAIEAQDYATAAELASQMNAAVVAPRNPAAAGPLPDGWQELKTAEGKAYYYQKATKKTQWRRPVEAPADKAAATSKPVARASNRQVNAAIDSATGALRTPPLYPPPLYTRPNDSRFSHGRQRDSRGTPTSRGLPSISAQANFDTLGIPFALRLRGPSSSHLGMNNANDALGDAFNTAGQAHGTPRSRSRSPALMPTERGSFDSLDFDDNPDVRAWPREGRGSRRFDNGPDSSPFDNGRAPIHNSELDA